MKKWLKLYIISQNKNIGPNTYDSAIVAAYSKKDARIIHPCDFVTHVTDNKWMGTHPSGFEYDMDEGGDWVPYVDINRITVISIGKAVPDVDRGVVLASFNAG